MRFPLVMTPLLTRAAFFVTFAACAAAHAATPSLSEVIAGMDTTSPLLAEARLKLSAVRSAYLSSRALPNPAFFAERQNLSGESGSETELTLGIQQPLGFLWSRAPRVSARKLSYEAEQAAYDETRRELTVRVVVAAASYRSLVAQRTMLDSVVQMAERAGRAMEARRREGDVSDYDAKRLQAELIQLQRRRLELTAELNKVAMEFVGLTGLPAEILLSLSPPELPAPSLGDVEAAVQYALQHRLRVESSRKSAEASRRAHTASKLNQLPDFSIGVARKTADPDFSGVLWQADIEIPVWGQRRSERNLARAEYERATVEYQAELQRIEQEVRAAMSEWTLLQGPDATLRSFTVEDAELSLNRGFRLYLSGEFGSLELVDALRTGLEALQAQLDLQTAFLTANLELRRVTGLAILEP